ncbi:alpha/beta hydrolase [bacterium]|nr:alpha/beta hydrolase [bacterium]MCI0606533.1 alpha/beta hydrolase [bacterium]
MPFIDVAGKQLEYERWVNPVSKPTLVFLHEGLGSLSMWRDFPEQVARRTGCSALAYSRAGYGNSDPADLPRSVDFMHEEAIRVLPEFLQKMQEREVILVGHSDGGSIALIYSATPVVPVRALVLESPHVFVEETTIQSISAAKEQYLRGDLKRRFAKHHGRVDETFLGWSDVWLRPEFAFWNIETFLPEIKIPALVIQGEEDRFGTIQQVEAIKKGCGGPVEICIIPECGHSPHREKPQQTLEQIVSYIERFN